MQVGGLVHRTA